MRGDDGEVSLHQSLVGLEYGTGRTNKEDRMRVLLTRVSGIGRQEGPPFPTSWLKTGPLPMQFGVVSEVDRDNSGFSTLIRYRTFLPGAQY